MWRRRIGRRAALKGGSTWPILGTPGHLVIFNELTNQGWSPIMTGSIPHSQHSNHRQFTFLSPNTFVPPTSTNTWLNNGNNRGLPVKYRQKLVSVTAAHSLQYYLEATQPAASLGQHAAGPGGTLQVRAARGGSGWHAACPGGTRRVWAARCKSGWHAASLGGTRRVRVARGESGRHAASPGSTRRVWAARCKSGQHAASPGASISFTYLWRQIQSSWCDTIINPW